MKKFIAIAFAICTVFVVSMTDASAISKGGVSVNSWKINGIRPTSFTSIDGSVALNITSERRKTTISNISGTIYSKKTGEAFIIGTADNVTIPRGVSTLVITGHGSLISYSAILSLLRNPSINPDDYTFDVRATVKTGLGRAEEREMLNVPLSSFLSR